MASVGRLLIALRLDRQMLSRVNWREIAFAEAHPCNAVGRALGQAICFGILVLARKCLIANEQCLRANAALTHPVTSKARHRSFGLSVHKVGAFGC